MDWFERLTGFPETSYEDTRRRLAVQGQELVSLADGRRWGVGTLELVSLGALRQRGRQTPPPGGRLKVRNLVGDVRRLHQDPACAGALFQVASQFNLLEMVSPQVTPEQGVARYAFDPTQGPACAIAAGAATIYRNHFVPVGPNGESGQTARRQIDALAPLGAALAQATGRPPEQLWTMRNGYALCTEAGLEAINGHLQALDEAGRDALRQHLHIGLHRDVEVTEAPGPDRPVVSQAFCSALPVAYSDVPASLWAPFATLVLEAAYEATLQAATLAAAQGGSSTVLLTRLGGGAFGNRDAWIDQAIERALQLHADADLEVLLVSRGAVHAAAARWEAAFG